MKSYNIFIFLFYVISIFFYGCNNNHKPAAHSNCKKIYPKYAKGFSINYYEDSTNIVVYTNFGIKDSLEIKIPQNITSIACFSSTHLAAISLLGKDHMVSAFSSKKYIYDLHKYRSDLIEIGEPNNIQFEKLLAHKPSIVILFGIDNQVNQTIGLLQKVEIPCFLNLEYKEEHPLAQAEWIKFFGALLHEEQKADSIFDFVEREYLSQKVSDTGQYRPLVMINFPWRGTWFISGNKTLISKYIEDAGGNYTFNDSSIQGNIPMNFEKVFKTCKNADIWLHPGIATRKKDMISSEPNVNQFLAYKKDMIFNNNKRMNSTGCNDFFESATMRPDLVLSDLKKIFQQDTNNLNYYRKIY